LAKETKNQVNTENKERQTIVLNEKEYYVDSFGDEQKAALLQVEEIIMATNAKKVDIRNLEYAKQYLVEYLTKNSEDFEEVPKSE
jgi:hypothetical protein